MDFTKSFDVFLTKGLYTGGLYTPEHTVCNYILIKVQNSYYYIQVNQSVVSQEFGSQTPSLTNIKFCSILQHFHNIKKWEHIKMMRQQGSQLEAQNCQHA
eukprot:TRINITY_DN6771_c0_g1_i2.p2 TRINITY_DN6771_c0_g1~~TRINITY_DN6771_c0_g1_i2.p2  ORF type:complete len:100 (-),score=0.04 TRINITY_DN6771_c0_g1_i2:237-536(-)